MIQVQKVNVLEVVLLAGIWRGEGHGYGLCAMLKEHGLLAPLPSIYRVLQTLSDKGLLVGERSGARSNGRLTYRLSATGAAHLEKSLGETEEVVAVARRLRRTNDHKD